MGKRERRERKRGNRVERGGNGSEGTGRERGDGRSKLDLKKPTPTFLESTKDISRSVATVLGQSIHHSVREAFNLIGSGKTLLDKSFQFLHVLVAVLRVSQLDLQLIAAAILTLQVLRCTDTSKQNTNRVSYVLD